VDDERDLVLAGFIAFLDPPKEPAGPALEALRQSGTAAPAAALAAEKLTATGSAGC
jgi:Mg2+-importing ATPase